jgi:hypothetical protein
MSLKAVELQVALPRTQEIGRLQDQQQQKTVHEQQININDRTQLDQQIRQRATDVNETAKSQIREKQEKEKRQKRQAAAETDEGTSQAAERIRTADHVEMRDPLRGRHIDISL